MPNLTQFEMDSIARAVRAIEKIANELEIIRKQNETIIEKNLPSTKTTV